MPILIKSIEGSVLSYFNDDIKPDHLGSINLINSFIGEVGVEDYINISGFEGMVQDFSSVAKGEFFETTPNSFGLSICDTHTEFNLSM